MKKLLFALALAAGANAFELFLNSGVEEGKNISVLHIRNKDPFSCEHVITQELKEFYKCVLAGKSKLISNQSLPYFDLKFINKSNSLEIYIYPKISSRLFISENRLYEEASVHLKSTNIATEFSLEFYPNLKSKLNPNGLDFSVRFDELLHPYIGALDLDQNPVNITDNNDISIYLSIKKSQDNKEYERLLEQSERAIRDYSSSIFLNEFYLFRLRALSGLLDSNTSHATSIIEGGKQYIRQFASSPNYAEVVGMIVHAYLRIQQRGDAEYFIDILNNEQPNDYYTKLANLDYADYLVAHKKIDPAVRLYNNILFGTQDATLASKAAIALAKINISGQRLEEAQEFVLKVLNANKSFLLENLPKTVALADEFYNHKMYEIAANLYELVLNNSAVNDSFHERVEKNIANALANLKRFDDAKVWLERYKKDYPAGEYTALMDELADSLYFESNESDSFKLHEYYRLLMSKYDNHIARRALVEESKLLFKERNYSEIFNLKERILASEDKALIDILRMSLKFLLSSALHQGECDSARKYLGELQPDDLLSLRHIKKLLVCLETHADYKKERELAQLFLQKDNVYYSIVLARLDYLQNDYKSTSARLYAALKTRRKITREEYAQIYALLAQSELNMGNYNQAIFMLKKLEANADKNMKLVEIYAKFLGYFKLHNLNISAINYGQKAINIQNHLGVNLYSPELEFITLEALLAQKNYKQMQEIITDLSKLNLNAEQRTRMLYLSALSLSALGDQQSAIKALKGCSEGQWLSLCKDTLKLLDPSNEDDENTPTEDEANN